MPGIICETHNRLGVRDDKYDAYYCPECNEWLESKCGTPWCPDCTTRPDKPVKVEKP